MQFHLDERLEQDSIWLKDHGSFRYLLANDNRFPWLIVVPMFRDVTEMYQLDQEVQQTLAILSARIGQQMMESFNGDSFNVAAIGNVVQQLHIHHVVRFRTDAAWPAPIWGFGNAVPYDAIEKHTRIAQMMGCLEFEIRN